MTPVLTSIVMPVNSWNVEICVPSIKSANRLPVRTGPVVD